MDVIVLKLQEMLKSYSVDFEVRLQARRQIKLKFPEKRTSLVQLRFYTRVSSRDCGL